MQTINPYEVKGEIDYKKVVSDFGLKQISDQTLERFEKLAKGSYYAMRRGIYFAERDLNWLMDQYEKGNRFYVYTGIAPSGGMHIGQTMQFQIAKWLQDRFDAEVLIMIPDEEKFLVKKNPAFTLENGHTLAMEDALDIAALGFDSRKTKIFLDTEYAKTLYKQAVRVSKYVTYSIIKDALGFGNDTNIGALFYTSFQAVPAFLKSVQAGKNIPCLIPMGVDQDVHFRIARNAIAKMGYYKPASLVSTFMPGLSMNPKMSASDPNNTIYLSDDEATVAKKVNKAITGQQDTLELQKKYGGNPDKCAVCQYYKYMFEPDDRKLAEILEGERKGTLLAGEHKKDLAMRINHFLKEHRTMKRKIEGKLEDFMLRD